LLGGDECGRIEKGQATVLCAHIDANDGTMSDCGEMVFEECGGVGFDGTLDAFEHFFDC